MGEEEEGPEGVLFQKLFKSSNIPNYTHTSNLKTPNIRILGFEYSNIRKKSKKRIFKSGDGWRELEEGLG